tara:strand:+ start:12917 stop:14110 length:1194 start_codon:yes stop_codon:yes gene_type:complete
MTNFFRYTFLGAPYFYHKYLIEKSERWNLSECEKFGKERFKHKILKFGNDIKNKKNISDNLDKMTILGNKIFCKTSSTGGTTGTPFVFKVNRFFNRQKERAYMHNIWSEIGYNPFDKIVAFRGHASKKLIKYNWIDNSYEISINKINISNKDILIKRLKKLGGFFLHVYPSSLYTFIDLIGEKTFRELNIKGVLAGSEKFPLEKMRYFEENYCIPISHWYGQSEYVSLAKFCKNCSGFHFFPTYGYTEFISRNNDSHNSIISTSFHNIGTNFVRYDTEDLVEFDNKQCQKPFRRVKEIVGRNEEYFIDNAGLKRAFGPFLFGIHNEFWTKIKNIQFIHDSKGSLSVEIILVHEKNYNWVVSFLHERFNCVTLQIKVVKSIKKTLSGKHKYFINNINK